MPALLPTGVDGDVAGGTVHSFLQNWGKLNSIFMLVLGDPVDGHSYEHDPNAMVEASPWFTITSFAGKRGVCRLGDLAECGHALAASQAWFRIS
jgi:uncharacterized Zn-binding protein involved in type VI secretion